MSEKTISKGKELYEYFMTATMNNRSILSWDELPQTVRDAWCEVYIIARSGGTKGGASGKKNHSS